MTSLSQFGTIALAYTVVRGISLRCGSCQHENPDGVKFCGECGSGIRAELVCRACGRSNPPSTKFCHECGESLGSVPESISTSAPSPALPVSFVSGRYIVKSFLGEGGRKRVYLAQDTKLDRDVAFAVIKTEGLDEAGLSRVQREAQAMGRLGDHPHIVTIHDVGEDGGQPYIVSQYMAGGDVVALIDSAPNRQLPVDQVVSLMTQVCEALEHAHGLGVIHRDIKPGNIWLTESGEAKLGDFGLAVSLDRSRLTVAGMMIGTVAYMSPEQAVGRQTDARSDLYSLGAMMYEMVTGRPPFLGEDIVSIVSQHINTAPVSPSWHRPDLPRSLEAQILRLLAKAPEDRPESATATLAALRAVSNASATSSEAVAEANPLDRLAGGIFVGREKELDELKGYLDDTFSGHGRTVLLVGEPGIGKTRTTEELVTYARLRNAQVLWGRCYESEAMPAYWPWIQIVRSYIHDQDPQTLISQMGSGAVEIAQVVSEVRERLPGLPATSSSSPEQARFRFFDGITQFLKNATKVHPVVIVLDDLHWADKSSLLLLQFVARETRSSRLLIVGTYRDIEVGRQHPLSQTLAELNREQLGQRMILRGLTEPDVSRFIYMTSGVEAPNALTQVVYRETEGNPFFVNEIVRLLVSDGRLEQAEDVTSWSVTIPQSVKEVVRRRLDHLSPDCNQALIVGAVIGREFDLGILKEVCEIAEDRLLDLLEEAVAERVIAEVPRTLGRYVFSHALIRETLASELSTARRVRLHRQIAQTLEGLQSKKPEAHLAQMAYHFFEGAQGGDAEKAVFYCRMAGDKALSSIAYEEAATHYENALQVLRLLDHPDQQGECDLLLALGDAQWKAGEPAKSRETYELAAQIARSEGLPEQLASAALGIGGPAKYGVVIDQHLVALLEEAIEVLPIDLYAQRARVLARLAQEVGGGGRPEEARALVLSEQAVALARKTDDRSALVLALGARYFIANRPGTSAERLSIANEMTEIAEGSGDKEALLDGHVLRLMSLFDSGRMSEADAEFELASGMARELRLPLYLWYSAVYSATRATMQGRLAEAEGLAAQGFAIGQRVEPQLALQCFSVQMLLIRRDQFRLIELEAQVKGFAAANPGLPVFRCALANLYKELGRPDEARDLFEDLASDDFSVLPTDSFRLVGLTQLSEVAAFLGHEDGARVLYHALEPFAHRHIAIFPTMASLGSCSQYLGLLASTVGRCDDAERHFRDALDENIALGAVVSAARTQCAFADMLIRRDSPGDHARASLLLTEALTKAQEIGAKAIIEMALALKVKLQGLDSMPAGSSIDSVVKSVSRDKPDLRSHAAPDGTVTLAFSDIEGSTILTEKLGDQRWMSLLREHNQVVRKQLRTHHGFEVKSEGDGFMLAFQSALHALRCAIAIQRDLAKRNEGAADPIRVRMGLHTGEVIKEANDFFGKNVILAARIAAQAVGGQILASSVVEAVAESSHEFNFKNPRELQLKGLAGTHSVVEVAW